jgi:predicted site-specific integrase-resolvase
VSDTTLVSQRTWARELGISVDTFKRWLAAGRIPPPIPNLSGWPRWSRKTVDRVTKQIADGGESRYFRTASLNRHHGVSA